MKSRFAGGAFGSCIGISRQCTEAARARTSGEKLLALIHAFLPLVRAQRPDSRSCGIQHGTRRQTQTDKIVAILPRQNQIMLAAIKAAAKQWTPLIDRASPRFQIHARPARRCGEQINRISVPVRGGSKLVRFDVVPALGVEKESLITSAACRAFAARYISRLAGGQIPF